ncbi:ABC transporter permease [Prolixibacteraceae bacterium JC049]|nr:ABC transporter permease [Prolixibacteraceae bacterium JC049]
MIQLKWILRLLVKDYKTTIIKVGSLVIGLTIALVIFLQVAHELNYDDFHPDKDRMYRIGLLWKNKGKLDDGHIIIAPLAAALKENLPEVEGYALLRRNWNNFYNKNKEKLSCKSIYADSTFFQFFHYPVLKRKTKSELKSAYKVFVSQKAAKQFFGREDVLGELIYDVNKKAYEIEGIFADVPSNSHLKFDIVVSFETIRKEGKMFTGWGGGDSFTGYLKLAPNVNKKEVEARVDDVIAKYYDNSSDLKSGMTETYYLQDLQDINVVYNDYTRTILKVLGAIGGIILIVSVLNYVLLALTSFYKQIYSLGIQQYTGASRGAIRKIVINEHLLVIGVSTLLALLLVSPTLKLTTQYWEWSNDILLNRYSIYFFSVIVGIVLLLSIGLPLMKLRSLKYRLIQQTKGRSRFENTSKKVLLSFQLVGATVLIIVLFMISKQLNYIDTMKLGFEANNRVYIDMVGKENRANTVVLMEELEKLSYVDGVSMSTDLLTYGLSGNSFWLPGDKDKYWISRYLYVEDHFHEVMGMNLLKGQHFTEFNPDASDVVIVNKKLVDMMQWENPIGQIIESNQMGKSFRVVGVVDDYVQNAHVNKQPAIFYKLAAKYLNRAQGYISLMLNEHTTAKQIDELRAMLDDHSKGAKLALGFYDDAIASIYETERQLKGSLVIFSVLAMLLAVIGLGGFVLNEVQRRTKEIGVRKVNGAKISEILTMLNKEFTRWVVLSFVIACPIAFFVIEQGLSTYAYKTDMSWWIFALAGVIALIVAVVTVSVQAFKTANQNPVEALRYE